MVVGDLDLDVGGEWAKGARWCIPAGSQATEFKAYAYSMVAKRYSEAGGSLPVKVYRSENNRLEYRCSSIPNKATERKTKEAMKAAGLEQLLAECADLLSLSRSWSVRQGKEAIRQGRY